MKIDYRIPTRLVFEPDCVKRNAELLRPFGARALLVTGAHSAKACGALDDMCAALARNGQSFEAFDRIPANPTVDCVYAGAAAARQGGMDFVVGIGGGSAMDAAKAIALLARTEIPREEIFRGVTGKRLPLVCVPTTAGTGSETTQYAILTNDEAQTKTSLASPSLFPDLALLDSRYLATLPPTTAVNTALDAFSHAAEGVLSRRASPLTDTLALEAVGRIAARFPALGAGALSDADREALLYASLLGGMVIAHTGTCAVHALGYSLTYFKHIDHGRANALLLPSWLSLAEKRDPERVAKILQAAKLPDVLALDEALAALLGPRERITPAEIERFSVIAAQSKNIANGIAAPTPPETAALYRQAFGLS